MAAEEVRSVTSREFSDYGSPLEMVIYFRYLGRVMSVADDDWMAVVRNMAKVQVLLRRMTRILINEGTRLQVSRFFFKAIIKLVLLFGAETWVVTPVWDGSWGVPRIRWRGS